MKEKSIYYHGNLNKPNTLIESEDYFVLGVKKNVNPILALQKIKGITELMPYFNLKAEFKESNVYVFQFWPEKKALRDELKSLIKSQHINEIIYIGTVFQFKGTGVYQIYTENLFIKFHSDVSVKGINAFFYQNHLKIKRPLPFSSNSYFVEPTIKSLKGRNIFEFSQMLLEQTEVELCHPELVSALRSLPRYYNNLPLASAEDGEQWWHKMVGSQEAWKYAKGKGVTIAIIDDGLEYNHLAFKNKIIDGRDMMKKGFKKAEHQYFNESHGTACSGIAASQSPLALGMAPEAKILPIRITGLGSVLESYAIYYAIDHGADIISCSWGPHDGNIHIDNDNDFLYPLPDHTRLAFEYANNYGRKGLGTPIVFAAGNGNESVEYDGYANSQYVFTVGAVNKEKVRSTYSDYGSSVLCAFPSGDISKNGKERYGIFVPDRIGEAGFSSTDYFNSFTGTSASCPGVAGIIALMLEINPYLNKNDIKNIIQKSCLPLSKLSDQKPLGSGIIQADLTVKNALTFKTIKPLTTKTMSQTKKAVSLHIGINKVDQRYFHNYVRELFGCINDMNKYKDLAKDLGYQTNTLENSEATKERIRQSITDLGNSLVEGGILLITYAGHGVQLKEVYSPEEEDGFDESWVVYDGFFVDDDIFNALAAINKKVRVVLISDSCHSETMTRVFSNLSEGEIPNTPIERSISLELAKHILKINNSSLEQLRAETQERSLLTYNAFVINISACKAEETAKEFNGEGAFTKAAVEVLKYLEDFNNINYFSLIPEINKRLVSFEQNPNISFSHQKSSHFIAQRPLSTDIIELDAEPNIILEPNDKFKDTNVEVVEGSSNYIYTESFHIYTADGEWKTINRNEANTHRILRNSNNSWDNAYDLLLKDETDIYVEPNQGIANKGQETMNNRAFLPSYPHATQIESNIPFKWHLDEKRSQLIEANEIVFPNIGLGTKSKAPSDVVKIAHIDTGIIYGHPALPSNLDFANLKSFGNGEEKAKDTDATLAAFEQHGHGNATAAILAGGWLEYEHTNNEYQGFFGAIPYAKILPIKISETVVILLANRFAQAVDYAIEQKCDIITMSMAGIPSKTLAQAVNKAYENGIIIVSAAGNSWVKGLQKITPKSTLYPARYDRVIAVTGATINGKPYLYNLHQNTRAAGGEFMQTCYGPKSVLSHTVAAYTPNISWFNQINAKNNGKTEYYTQSGGGTSSATPQVAAAAALYVQKHKDYLSKFSGRNAWKKAEIVRQVLFQSAEYSQEYQDVYGNGLLKAKNMLDDNFAPQKIEKTIKKAKEAAVESTLKTVFKNIFWSRGLENLSLAKEENLRQMMANEILQLIYTDPNLFQYTELHIDNSLDEIIDLDLLQKIVNSPYASNFLKSIIHNNYSQISPSKARALNSSNTMIDNGNFITQGVDITITKNNSYTDNFGKQSYHIEEVEFELVQNRTLDSNTKPSLRYVLDEEHDAVLLIEKTFANDESIILWQLPEKLNHETRGSSQTYFEIPINQEADERSIGDGLKKIGIKVFKWAKSLKKIGYKKVADLAEPLGDGQYELKYFDLKQNVWSNHWNHIHSGNQNEIFKNLENDSKEVLIAFPGLFSTVEKGFDDFLQSEENRKKLLKDHCQYILGINIPTVFHGIEKNAETVNDIFQGKLKHKKCNVMARSRGGVLARYLFEKTWVDNRNYEPLKDAPFVLNKLIMFGTPNQGTMMADTDNWSSLLNYTTNIAKVTLGTIAPIVPKILSIVKAASLGVLHLPGINDLEEESELLKQLNELKNAKRSNYFVFTSNFEPKQNIFKRLLDEFAIDRAIFKRETNDGVTPVTGAIFKNEQLENSVQLEDHQYHISSSLEQVSHFSYLHSKHPEILEKLFEILS